MRLPSLPLPLWVARGVFGARRRVLDLADAVVPGEFALFSDVAFGLQKLKIAGLLVSSGLADALGKDSCDPIELAQQLGLDPDVTVRIVNAAIGSRLIKLDRQGRARMTKVGAPLCREHPNSIASWIAYYAHPETAAVYSHLDAQLREGAQSSGYQRAFGKSLWDYLDDRPDMRSAFADAMRQLTEFDLAGIVRTYPWPGRGVICDVAGGGRAHAGGYPRASPGRSWHLARFARGHRAGLRISAGARVGRADRVPRWRPVRSAGRSR